MWVFCRHLSSMLYQKQGLFLHGVSKLEKYYIATFQTNRTWTWQTKSSRFYVSMRDLSGELSHCHLSKLHSVKNTAKQAWLFINYGRILLWQAEI